MVIKSQEDLWLFRFFLFRSFGHDRFVRSVYRRAEGFKKSDLISSLSKFLCSSLRAEIKKRGQPAVAC